MDVGKEKQFHSLFLKILFGWLWRIFSGPFGTPAFHLGPYTLHRISSSVITFFFLLYFNKNINSVESLFSFLMHLFLKVNIWTTIDFGIPRFFTTDIKVFGRVTFFQQIHRHTRLFRRFKLISNSYWVGGRHLLQLIRGYENTWTIEKHLNASM